MGTSLVESGGIEFGHLFGGERRGKMSWRWSTVPQFGGGLELGQHHYPQRCNVVFRLHRGGIPRRYCLGIVRKSGLALLSPRSLAGKPDVEAAAAKPQEDSLGCRHLTCKSSAFGHKATSSLLVEKALTTCSLLVKKPLTTDGLLAFVGGTLIKESLAAIGLRALMSGFLIEMALAGCRLEAMVLVLPQVVDCPLPIPVGVFRAGASPM
jgi:hypothetical protein